MSVFGILKLRGINPTDAVKKHYAIMLSTRKFHHSTKSLICLIMNKMVSSDYSRDTMPLE